MIWKPHAIVAAIIQRDDKYLIVEEINSKGQVVYTQPAGHVEENESHVDAVIREVREETAWDFVPDDIVGYYRWFNPSNQSTQLRMVFSGQVYQHHPNQHLDEGIISAQWLTLPEIEAKGDALRSPLVLQCIDDYRKGHRYPLELLRNAS